MVFALHGHRGFIFLLVFTLIGAFSIGRSAIGETQLSVLNELALKCFSSRQMSPCQLALSRAESLQRIAAMKKNYSCQTLALGLGADLIMSQNREGRGQEALQLLEEVNKICSEY